MPGYTAEEEALLDLLPKFDGPSHPKSGGPSTWPSHSEFNEPPKESGGVDWDEWHQRFDARMGKPHVPKQSTNDDRDGDQEVESNDEDWADAVESHSIAEDEEQEEKAELTIEELRGRVKKATKAKSEGNTHFSATPPNLDSSLACYKSALNLLPLTTLSPDHPSNQKDPQSSDPTKGEPETKETVVIPDGGIVELSDDQVRAIELEEEAKRLKEEEESKPKFKERRGVEEEVENLKKVVWSNMGAVYVKKGDDKEAVKACTEALKIDPLHVKALHRRATANERIDSWSSLQTALDDYKSLLPLLPSSSPLLSTTRTSLRTLPTRISTKQKSETDEMMGKLKELGNGILGKFGLSTDNFKFDEQAGGGYSMRFER